MRRIELRAESGQASAELMGALWWVLLAAVGVWQILLATWTINEASNAARTGSRIVAREGNPKKAALNALSSGLRGKAWVDHRSGSDRVTVHVPIPIIVPGVSSRGWTATRSAELPS